MEMSMAAMQGPRLAYVVVPIKKTVKRMVTTFEKGVGLREVPTEEEGGYLVYFPRGHALRLTEKELKRYKLGKRAKAFVDLAGLTDPESPMGKVFMAQNDQARTAGWRDLEKMVIQLATARSGPVVVAEEVEPTNRDDPS